jgi:hypothetical protein
VALAWSAMASALIYLNRNDWLLWYFATLDMSVLALFVLLADPHEFGLHGVYRDRICRAFLGAAYPGSRSAADNRQTDFRPRDDVRLSSLPERPLHLICCAANNISGDHLATLSRGARSAVLSHYGVAVGNDWAPAPNLYLGSALTASAAAFNSNMGSVSMRVGPAVSFLMGALNLRLGLWVRNPGSRRKPDRPSLLPGWLFYKEMAAGTSSDAADLHLSDGAHFDNLGLYELVRRHCRYIIVSDCTADPDVGFDDFGSTARRIREDLGVEIEIDLNPLKPGPGGYSRQHAAVGTIDYGWFDKGILVYIKPSLTGDEPADIRQYKTRNHAFPHESTGDQFYDEAQWESYRRLGVQAVREVFRFVDRVADGRERPHKVFAEVKQQWYPAPADLVDRLLQMSSRFDKLEEELRSSQNVPMLGEVFPEIQHMRSAGRASAFFLSCFGGRQTSGEAFSRHQMANVGCLLRVLTLMEDTVTVCALTTHWDHPLNRGWVNYFARWATAPTFRMWWPMLKPMYGPALRGFLEDRFEILRGTGSAMAAVSRVDQKVARGGFAFEWWRERVRMRASLNHRQLFQYSFRLPAAGEVRPAEIQVALAAVLRRPKLAFWTTDDFFVPLSLWGGGLGAEFLRSLMELLREEGVEKCVVAVLAPPENDGNRAVWYERLGFLDFYRQAGFRVDRASAYPQLPLATPGQRQSSAVLSRLLVP